MAALLLLCQGLAAHPHTFVTVESEFVLGADQRLQQIRQVWTFDTFYSVAALEESKDAAGKLPATALRDLGQSYVTNLREYDYFSLLQINGVAQPIPQPSQFELLLQEGAEGQQLVFSMQFEFADGPLVQGKRVEWSVFDPTYYVAYNYAAAPRFGLRGEMPAEQCEWQLEMPNPSEEMVNYAASLDQNQRDSDGLGLLFAEKIQLRCS